MPRLLKRSRQPQGEELNRPVLNKELLDDQKNFPKYKESNEMCGYTEKSHLQLRLGWGSFIFSSPHSLLFVQLIVVTTL